MRHDRDSNGAPSGITSSQLAILKKTVLFRELSEDALLELLKEARIRKYKENQNLFWEGDDGTKVFVILSGQIAIERFAPDGATQVVAVRGAGQVIGEIALFHPEGRSADARTTMDSEILALDGDWLMTKIRQTPDLALGMLTLLASKLRESIDARVNQKLKVSQRLAIAIVHEFRVNGRKNEAGDWELNHRVTQTEWGSRIGATREHVNRALKELAEMGLLEIESGSVVVTDRDGLKEFAFPPR